MFTVCDLAPVWTLIFRPQMSINSSASGANGVISFNLVCRPSQFFTTAHLVEDNVGGGLPSERLGRLVPACKPRIDGAFQFFHRVESAAPNHFVSDEPKPPFHLIEPGTAGGCEMEVKAAAFQGLEPTLHGGALVGAVVVENEVEVEFRGYLLFQWMEESDELFAAMARQATTDDLAVEDIEGGKQWGGSVPLGIMRLAFRQSRPQGQTRSGSVQRLDLALFIDAEYQGPVWRVEIQANDVPHLVFKLRILGNLELLDPVGLDVVMLPDALYHHARHTQLCGQYSDAPVRRVGRSGLQSCAQNLLLHFRGECPG